jgi:sugar/nucleoside kinase (ribokinase family)
LFLQLENMQYDVAVIADIFADVVIMSNEMPLLGQSETLADGYAIELGGSGPIFAAQFAKLGGRIALLGIIGTDLMGDFVNSRLTKLGITTKFIQRSSHHKTPLGLNISIEGDRSMLTFLGCIKEIAPSIIDDSLLTEVKHWHIASFFLLSTLVHFWPVFLRRLKKKNITCSLDTNWAPQGNWKQVAEILPFVDIFLPNEVEAKYITGEDDYRRSGIELSKIVPLVVIKRREKGASAFVRGVETLITVQDSWDGEIEVIDTTGAGDSFDGGFIFEWLNQSSLEQCLRTAIQCGTRNVQYIGGINHLFAHTLQ